METPSVARWSKTDGVCEWEGEKTLVTIFVPLNDVNATGQGIKQGIDIRPLGAGNPFALNIENR